MNLEQIKEKYGNVKLKFNGYYEYSFSFTGKTEDNEEIYVSVSGNANNIYKLDVSRDKEETINTLCPNYITVSKNGYVQLIIKMKEL
jgi:hypothetical protein